MKKSYGALLDCCRKEDPGIYRKHSKHGSLAIILVCSPGRRLATIDPEMLPYFNSSYFSLWRSSCCAFGFAALLSEVFRSFPLSGLQHCGLWTRTCTSWRCQRKMYVRLGASIQWNDFARLFMCQENCVLADCRDTLSKHMAKKAHRLEDVGMGRRTWGNDQCLWHDLAQVDLIFRFDRGSRIK